MTQKTPVCQCLGKKKEALLNAHMHMENFTFTWQSVTASLETLQKLHFLRDADDARWVSGYFQH